MPPSFSTKTPDPRKARLWYRQAEMELKHAKEHNAHFQDSGAWMLVFLLHQVVEKVLKAAGFYEDGNGDNPSNDLLSLARNLPALMRSDGELTQHVSGLIRLGVDFQTPRYPDGANLTTSKERYRDFPAEDALDHCEKIVTIVRDAIGIRPL